jgi:high-affinity K+ transport system ATPase subunit B/membrane-associated phospholipid phosphatase
MDAMELGNASDAANLILAALAVCLAVFGTAAWWVAAHPRTVRAFIIRLRRHPRVIRAERRYYNQIEFLVRRFRPEGAFGLSFTIGLAVLAATAWIFGGVLQDVLAHEEIALFDEPIVSYIATHRLAWLTECMEAVTYLGSGAFLAAGVIVGGLALRIRTGSWRPLLLLAYAAAGSGLLGAFLRWAIARPRPAVEWMAVSTTGWGFPSGHTTASTAVYGALAYLVAQTQSDWQGKVRWLTVGALIAFMVGVSRVYLGVHWPTDVIAGWALGTAWLAILFITASTIEQSRSSVALPSSSYARNQLADSAEPDGPPQQPEVKRRTVARGGLTDAEVRLRLAQGEVNTTTERTSRSVGEILRANILTRFNALLGSLFVLMLWIGPPQDALFGGILAVNTLIGVVQELRAKRTLDRLVLLTAPAARVVRAGLSHEIPVDEIVLDDVLELRRGDQIQVDGLVLEATALEVDESLLTGESEPVAKQAGDEVLSGSFVLAGGGLIQTVRVGSKSYSRALATEARKFTLARSEIREGIDRILAYVTWLLVPTAVLLIITQLLETQAGWRDAVASSVGAVVGMVPEGLVLLTSVALAVAVVRLARSHVLIQELPAIELLARVDVVCFDKTGTLTDGRIVFEQLVPAAGFTESAADLREVLAAIAASDPNPNASLVAIAEKFRSPVLQATATVPFSSSRKWSAATFGDRGTWVLGAPEVLLSHIDHSDRIHNEAERIASTGRRVLALSYTSELPGLTTHRTLPDGLTPAALVVLGEQLRSDASATIRYFAEQGLALKVISGDSASTVAAVAAAAGITVAEKAVTVGQFSGSPGALSDAAEKMSVFGRVAPSLKRALIAALRQRGHVVAMVGDGGNDALEPLLVTCSRILFSETWIELSTLNVQKKNGPPQSA